MISTDDHVVVDFIRLFDGRDDAHGADHGECVRSAPLYVDHLDCPDRSIGVYPIDFRGLCRWGCVDLDIYGDKHPNGDYATESAAAYAAKDLLLSLDALNLTGWPEVTRSRGRHVWVFAQQPVPARVMRRALLVACQVAEIKPTEINPKQESLPDGSLGNYVRLPYPHGWKHAMARYVYSGPLIFDLETFVKRAMQSRASVADLQAAADLYTPPAPRIRFTPVALPALGQSTVLDRLGPVGRAIYRDGPLDGSDRSGTLVRLAAKCCAAGLTPSEARALIEDADAAWGKFSERPDRDRRYDAIVEAGYR